MARGYLVVDIIVGRRKESWEALRLTAWVLTGGEGGMHRNGWEDDDLTLAGN